MWLAATPHVMTLFFCVWQDWHTWLLNTFENLQLDGIIYLRTKPDTCLKRCRKRSRSEEGGIPIEYLTQIHERHERYSAPPDARHLFFGDGIFGLSSQIHECHELYLIFCKMHCFTVFCFPDVRHFMF